MTDEEFRADLLAAISSRAEANSLTLREAFVSEFLERLRDAGELPDSESCADTMQGHRERKLEIDAFAFDEADSSIHLFAAIQNAGLKESVPITLTEARSQGFNRLLGVFEQAREGWLTKNIEEKRPLWALARKIQTGGRPAALRLNVLTDRTVSERLREIPAGLSREKIPLTFQIWDLSRLKRVHDAHNVRDDLIVDFSLFSGGGLAALSVASGVSDYEAYLAVVPGEALADIYIRHGSRLLESNVRTFLGRRGNINKGIANTLAKEPARFFAYNNGIAATATAVSSVSAPGATLLLTSATDFQIVNGAQTTASLAALSREGKLRPASVFVPMKLSVVRPDVAAELIPRISRFSNSQNSVRASDFFANHEFHRRMEEISRRILAPAVGGSQVQTHWYYERARGQHLNDQAGMTPAKREQFLRLNPRDQLITKTDLAKVESCFDLLPDIACKGAEKSFTEFAGRITKEWTDELKRNLYGDEWYRAAVARMILFRTAESLVSNASWYEGGYRAQIVAYAIARLSALAENRSGGGSLDYRKIWVAQGAGGVLERQILSIAEAMMKQLQSPPQAGQNISEWAKQQACRKGALEAVVAVESRFDTVLVARSEMRSNAREERGNQRVTEGLAALQNVIALGADVWLSILSFGKAKRLLTSDDEQAVRIACSIPRRLPTDWQAERLLVVLKRCEDAGLQLPELR